MIIFQNIFATESDVFYVVKYLPFYLLYYIMMALQTQFAQTAFSLAIRYRRLNMAIESAFSLSKSNLFEAFRTIIMQKLNDAYTVRVHLGKVMQLTKDKKSNSENVPGVFAANLVTVSRAVHDENLAASTAARTTVNRKYFSSFACDLVDYYVSC